MSSDHLVLSHVPQKSKAAASKAERNSAIWLISFGDLLTLLLCFFLSIISLSPLNPANSSRSKSSTTQNQTQIPPLVEASNEKEGRGTPIAEKKGGDALSKEIEMRFKEEDFSKESEDFFGMKSKLQSLLVIPIGYEAKQVNISSCSKASKDSEGQSWRLSEARAVQARSQILDAVRPTSGFRVRVLGPNCDDESALTIKVSLVRKANG